MSTQVMELTERQLREKEFYEKYAVSFDVDREVDFSPVSGRERRPWNSYWMFYHLLESFHWFGARLLDFGSGPGDNALRFSRLGYSVEGFDISDANVAVAQRLFKKHNTAGRFQVASAEALPYGDNEFDVIAGVDILHHVDIREALLECRRVLKPQGIAIFREPVEVPFLDRIRNTAYFKMLAPKETSLDLHITEDERKLNNADFEVIREVFPDLEVREFFLFARFDRFFRKGSDPEPSFLERLDYFLFNSFPVLRHLGGARIIVMRKA